MFWSEAISAFEEQKTVLASHQKDFVSFVEADVQTAVRAVKEDIIFQKASEEKTRLTEATKDICELKDTKIQKLKELRETTTTSLNEAEEAYKNVNSDNVVDFGKDIDSACNEIALQKSKMETTIRLMG